ncbi:putative UvsX protein [Pseudomonas phage Noxifer]|uniref:Putative UvsX protein n=1 Tax=Pseudomonas phage Noxifer TaxID=2006684 RepID=A0A1Y0SUZ8_9CAUD|nr:putative UvsX protein [Pseudomonas phage Noxifer]ARV77331.1 putative UvsX protein [Pseudomonas phage Noxifer]
MFGKVIEKPLFRPSLNVGGMYDIPTGHYELGKNGESIFNGGVGPLTGIASRPNNFKTALAIFMQAMIRRAFQTSAGLIYDTEGTLSPIVRFQTISMAFAELAMINWEEDELYTFTDLSRYTGDVLMKLYRDTVYEKTKDPKKNIMTTPFLDKDGDFRQAYIPTSLLIDSFSKFQIKEVQDMYDKNKIGDSKNNTDAMTSGKAKTQLFNQMPTMVAQTGSYVIMTAHVGDIINMEMYPTDKRNLSHMKKDTVIKGVGPGFYSMPHNVWDIMSNKPLVNKEKMPVFPLDNKTAMEGDSDLKLLEVQNLRGKGGITGLAMPMIMSQTEGYLPSLTELYYCRENEFGFNGNNINYQLALAPDVNLTRTTVRAKLNESEKLRRVTEIQAEMLQLIQFHRTDSDRVFTDPATLYADLKAIGYDWDVLLNTRGFWVFKEQEHMFPKPFLSTMDLLRMRKGLYAPYWLPEADRERLKAAALKHNLGDLAARAKPLPVSMPMAA